MIVVKPTISDLIYQQINEGRLWRKPKKIDRLNVK